MTTKHMCPGLESTAPKAAQTKQSRISVNGKEHYRRLHKESVFKVNSIWMMMWGEAMPGRRDCANNA